MKEQTVIEHQNKYFFDQHDHRWYQILASRESEWGIWRGLDDGHPNRDKIPEFAKMIGHPRTTKFFLWPLSREDNPLRNAIHKHLPLLRDMASQVITPKDNTMSRMVKDFESALNDEHLCDNSCGNFTNGGVES